MLIRKLYGETLYRGDKTLTVLDSWGGQMTGCLQEYENKQTADDFTSCFQVLLAFLVMETLLSNKTSFNIRNCMNSLEKPV